MFQVLQKGHHLNKCKENNKDTEGSEKGLKFLVMRQKEEVSEEEDNEEDSTESEQSGNYEYDMEDNESQGFAFAKKDVLCIYKMRWQYKMIGYCSTINQL